MAWRVIDPGCRATQSWDALLARLAQLGAPACPHPHRRRHPLPPRPLRVGRPAAIRERRRAPHARDVPHLVDPRARRHRPRRRRPGPTWPPRATGRFRRAVGAQDALGQRRATARPGKAGVGARRAPRPLGTPTPTIRVADAEVSASAGASGWPSTRRAHADHLCLHDPDAGVLLSGDHVLPTITPHISGHRADRAIRWPTSSTPSTAWSALDASRPCCPPTATRSTIWPGRATDIKDHHEERLDRLRTASAEIGRAADGDRAVAAAVQPQSLGPDGRSPRPTPTSSTCASRARPPAGPSDGVLLYSIS